jgi:hypothetical protein
VIGISIALDCRDMAGFPWLYRDIWLLKILYKDGKRYILVKKPGIKFPWLFCAPSAEGDPAIDFR